MKPRPQWLTDEAIASMRQDLKDCPNPYTDEDMANMENDDPNFSIIRFGAYNAKRLLTKYGIPLTDEEDTTE